MVAPVVPGAVYSILLRHMADAVHMEGIDIQYTVEVPILAGQASPAA